MFLHYMRHFRRPTEIELIVKLEEEKVKTAFLREQLSEAFGMIEKMTSDLQAIHDEHVNGPRQDDETHWLILKPFKRLLSL